MRFRSNRRLKEVVPQTGFTLAQVSTVVSICGLFLGGAWILFQFIFTKFIEPRLIPAVVQTSVEANYVGQTNCCVLYEVETLLENKGARDVVVHSSHQIVGARRIQELSALDDATLNEAAKSYVESNLFNEVARKRSTNALEYIAIKAKLPFYLISAGNIIGPGFRLSPREIHKNRSVAIVPKEFFLVSIRGTIFVSHFERSDLDWRWQFNAKTLEPLPLPWMRNEELRFQKLTKCAVRGETHAERNQCTSLILNEADDLFKSAWESDVHSYSQSYALDFLALAPPASTKK